MRSSARIGVTHQIGSVLGSWGARSPIYMSSQEDVIAANEFMLELSEREDRVFAYCYVNPAHGRFCEEEIERCGDRGAVGLKLAAARRANDSLVGDVVQHAVERQWPVLHHIWQHRGREWEGQVASDAEELCELARSYPQGRFILAHIGGGGAWQPSLRSVQDVPNVYVDLSGSGVDNDMLTQVISAVGTKRVLFGTDITIGTGLVRLRHLERLALSETEVADIHSRNAKRIFFAGGVFMTYDAALWLGSYPFRYLEPTSVDALLEGLHSEGCDGGLVGHWGSVMGFEPARANTHLIGLLSGRDELEASPTMNPFVPGWEKDVESARSDNCRAVRVFPGHQGQVADSSPMKDLLHALGEAEVVLQVFCRFEDGRQRPPADTAPFPAAAEIRNLVAGTSSGRLLISGASRGAIEEVHHSLTTSERERLLWDASWLAGPPSDDLSAVLEGVGADRLCCGSGYPLRAADVLSARLEASGIEGAIAEQLLSSNLKGFVGLKV